MSQLAATFGWRPSRGVIPCALTIKVSENITLIRLLELGLGFGVLPREIAAPLIDEDKLVCLNQGRSHKIAFALAWYPRKEMPDYFREIVQMIK